MNEAISLRWANSDDYTAVGEVMFDAVRHGRSGYNDQQRQAWVPQARSGEAWDARLAAQRIILAEQEGQVVGFMSLAANAYIDFAYIRPVAQGRGLFRRLYNAIENLARQDGETLLWVHASLMALPAFSSMGFSVIKKESVLLGGEIFERFEMEKHLSV